MGYGVISLCWRLYIIINHNELYSSVMPQAVIHVFENSYTLILGLAIITITTIFKILILSNQKMTYGSYHQLTCYIYRL